MVAVERAIRMVSQKYPSHTIREICEEEGIILRRDGMGENFFGLYTNLYGQAVINIRDDLNVQVTTGVMAHEYFHHFSFQLSGSSFGRNLITERKCIQPFLNLYMRKEEHEADLFAAYFVCPDVTDCSTYYDIMRKRDCSKEVAKLRMVAEQQRIYGGLDHGFLKKER